ncbi:AbrB/MazE/SpoVT family DNA-binding domain-containing protein [Ammoniphilus resinae]|uniref:AbrB/MazE/SpoVT family DNA-binding domain-containing protein n=1 Tax=Ammoniphilus resinae TaxID=861532 RepID=UPI001AE96067
MNSSVCRVSKISSKGQIIIPKVVREVINLHKGDRIAFNFENVKFESIRLILKNL